MNLADRAAAIRHSVAGGAHTMPPAHLPTSLPARPTLAARVPVPATSPDSAEGSAPHLNATTVNVTERIDPLRRLKSDVTKKLFQNLNVALGNPDIGMNDLRTLVVGELNTIIGEGNASLTLPERTRLTGQVVDDVLGLGPLEALLNDETVSEIMVNGPKRVYVERKGKLALSDTTFEDEQHLRMVIDRIVSGVGRRIDESSPLVDARLLDGSRVNAVIPPLAFSGSTLTIRKFDKTALTVEDLIRWGSISEQMAGVLRACVEAKSNILVAGGTGTGKTSLLNIISSFIPADERIITIEDSVELKLQQPHVVQLESRPPNAEGKGAVEIRELVKNSLRMRPDRIVIGECRSGEALDMLQAMNTGHDGSLTTLHANSPRDAISRLETLVLMAGMDLPQRAIREQIASAINLVVQMSRLRDGSRKVVAITEVAGMEGDTVTLQDVFTYQHRGMTDDGKLRGTMVATGVRPKFADKFDEYGITYSPDLFASETAWDRL